MNYIGLVAAVSAFLAIWIGHVAVRKIEASTEALWVPAVAFNAAGLLLEGIALITPALPLATACGIVGVTLLWDALELRRQERRVRRGHAPANPRNPRHAAILLEAGSRATTEDLLKRDPTDAPPENGTRTPVLTGRADASVEERGIIY